MKRKLHKTTDGKTFTELIPETDEDWAKLKRLDEKGLLETESRFYNLPRREELPQYSEEEEQRRIAETEAILAE